MPRGDLFHDPSIRSFRAAFWGTVPIPARTETGFVELGLKARLATGVEQAAPLGRIEISAREPAPAPGRPAGRGLVAVCMATCDPDPSLFRAQVASLRAQTDTNWVCVISDDASRHERFEAIAEAVAGDARFTLSRSERRVGFYGNFEQALKLAPAGVELMALCDQDDVWHPDKLQVLRGALGSAMLAYSDQRLVDTAGRVVSDTLWEGRRNNYTDLASLLVANTITGAATLFRREVADLALPFPDAPGVQFHDHWLALVALCAGDIAYVDRPLYDYVQHGSAVFGELRDGGAPRPGLLRGGRGAYFLGYLGREVLAQTLLIRLGERLPGPKRRALRRYVAAARSPLAFAWLAYRSLRRLAGRNETLGSEAELARGLAWRWLVAVLATGTRRPDRRPLHAAFPDEGSFQQRRLARWRAHS
jgi:glycosyltransferase involved in cell wall biosynthesis